MAVSFFDAPGAIRTEGNTQTLVFTRTSDTTGTVCWSPTPPTPLTGCGTPTGHYAGGTLVVSTSPIEQSNKPRDGICCYTGDTNISPQLFAGDTIGGAKVVWSSNTDATTGCVSITGLDSACTSYYFAFFAIDKTCQYNPDGIFSYSSANNTAAEIKCTAGLQCIMTAGVTPTDPLPGVFPSINNYPIGLTVDTKPLSLSLRGTQLTTYQSLVDELNNSWKYTAVNHFEQAQVPYYGQFTHIASTWSQWTGTQYNLVRPILSPTDPTIPVPGALWYDITNSQLKTWSGTNWTSPSVPILSHGSDPTLPQCDEYWYDGVVARLFDGVVWKNVPTIVGATDPRALPTLDCVNFWRPAPSVFKRWSDTANNWSDAAVLVMQTTPHTLTAGTLWYNPMSLTTHRWDGTTWILLTTTISVAAPTNPAPNQYWVEPLSKSILKYDASTSSWLPQVIVVYHKDPTLLAVADVLYNTTQQTLSEWNGANWVDITNKMFDQSIDPSLQPSLDQGTLWYNSTLNLWFSLVGTADACSWVGVNVVQSPIEPNQLTVGYWFNTTTRLWYQRSGLAWTQVFPTSSLNDPTTPPLGTTWFDGLVLYQRDATPAWQVIPYTNTAVSINVGTRWLNTSTGALNVWTGSDWEQIQAPFLAGWTDTNNIKIVSQLCGEPSMIEITSAVLFLVDLGFTLGTPVLGLDGYSGRPMTEELGVGTDGSADDRRKIINNLYTRLGAPTVNVELSREQMDLAVQKGLDYIRRDSGAGNSRAYFFLDLKENQQHYLLTSRSVGFNKIVDVLNLYRTRGGTALASASNTNDFYGQQLLQQLYSTGTFDLVSHHLLAAHQQIVNKLFVRELQFQWTERKRQLSIHRNINRAERVLVDAVIERTEQDLLTDRMTKNWIEDWALSEAMIMLGNMRGKFSTIAGAGGSITLNAESLKSEAVAMQTLLITELDDFVASDIETWGIGASITKG